MCQCLNMLDVPRHKRGKRLGACLVLEPCVSCVVRLQHVLMFDSIGCARAWKRHAPRYVPSVRRVYHDHCCMRDW